MKTFTSRFKVRIILLFLLFTGFNINAQTFEITDNTTTSIQLSFSTTAEGVIILHSSDGTFTNPTNGVAYSQGNTIGSNEVVYVGNTSPTSHSSLTANTHYYYRAWEYDASDNYTLIDSDDAYTLKYAPTYHATNFSATVNDDQQISLSWTDASGFVSPDYYLIKASSVSYADITAPVDGTAEADASLVKNIAQGTQAAVFTGLDANTTYYFKLYPYTNSGDKVDYKTSTSTLPTVDAKTELSASSDIIEQTGFSYAQNIDYISEVGADVTSANTSLWGLTIRDGGASADDNDLEPTILNDITISITNHSYLNKIAIYDGTTEIQEVAAAASVSFTGLGLQANDDGTKDFQIKATYNTSITDNEIISFSIESANLSADAAGSDFGTFATISSSTVSPNNQLEVDASELSIIQQPTNVYSDYAIDPAVTIEAIDANGNRDLDYTTDVTTSVNAGSVTLSGTNTATPISGLATFDDIQFSDGGTGVTLDFNSTGLSSATSNTFDVTLSTPEIQISEGATILDAADGATDVNFGDVEWGTTSAAISLTIENIGKAELTITTPVGGNGDFAVSTQPTSPVNAGNSTTIGIEFTPTSAGSITGKITITNNDSDEGSFVINLEGNGTLNQNSSVSASSFFDPADNIVYLNYLSTDLSASLSGSIKIAEFTINDGTDDDDASTILTAIEIGISNFDNLNRIAIYDGSTIYNKAAAATVSFSGLNIEATDNSSTNFEIYASFNTTVTDNEQIQLTINSVTADATGSGFAAADGGAATSPIVIDDNRIEVEATKLFINSVDNPVDVSTNFNLSIQALDANDNLDLDESSSVTLALNSGSGILSSATSLTQSLSSGEYSWTDLQYDTEQTFEIEAQSVDLANDLSGNINVNASSSSIAETPVSGQISSQTISSLDDTDAEAVDVFRFNITDDGDGNGLSTDVTNIRIKADVGNNINWTDHIQDVIINAAGVIASTSTISSNQIDLSIVSGNLVIADGASREITISVYLNTSNITDNGQLQMFIDSDNHGFTAEASGSGFATAFNGDINSNIHNIEVIASKLFINSVDNPVDVSTNFNLSVQALDANDNLDLDESSSVTLALSSGSGILSSATSLTQSLSSGEYSWTDIQYDTEQTFEIEAQSASLANALSGSIDVNPSSSSIAETPVSGQIVSQTISSLDDTDAEAVDVFRFNITDDGDGNGLSTDVTNIRIKADVGNNINWTDHIQDVIIDAAGVITSTSTISSNQIDLSIVSGNLVIADGDSREITISVYLNTSNITDNGQLQMFIDSDDHGFTAEASGSGFATAFNGDINSNIHTIEVVASELSIITQPTDVYTDYAINPDVVVEAVDANGNRDLDYAENIDIEVDGTPTNPAFSGSATTTVIAASGLATFDNIIFSTHSSGSPINLSFSSTGTPSVSSELSNGFEVMESLPEINITQAGTTYLNTSTYDFSNTEIGISNQVDFVIENTGQKVLNISSSSVSGSMYSLITSAPASIAASSSATITVAFDPASVGNFTGTLEIDHDDATDSEDPYTINLGGDGIPNNNSSIIETPTFTYNENIDYSLYQSTNITSDGAGSGNIQIGEFTIQDGPDGDVQTTTLTAISFNVSNSSNLNKIAIVNGSSVVVEQSAASTVSFSGLSLTAADGGTKPFKVYASFNSSVNDNEQIQLTISSATAAAGSSGFASADAGGASSSIVGDDNKLVVEASEIVFTTYPASVDVASNFTIAVEAIDANGNRDLDETSDVTLSIGSGSGGLTNVGPTAFSSGYVEFTTVQYDNEDDFSVDAIADAPLSKSVVGALITTNRAEQLFASAPTSQIAANTISSVDNDDATESLSVFKFDLTDDGSGSGDNSVLTNIRIIPAASNTADWADVIQGVKLNDGSSISIGSPTITSTYIDIPLTGGYTINDGSTVEITMDIYLNQTDLLVDGEVISLMIDADNHNWTDDGSGSALKTDFGSDVISNDFTIDVEASELNFVTVPSSVTIGNQFTVEVEAVDVHGNRDTDESSSVTIAKNTGTGDLLSSSYSINLSSGIASWSDLEYNIAEVFKVDISHATYTTIISDDITANDIAAPNSPSISIDYLANNQIQISITKPSGSFGSDWDGYLVFAREASSNDADISSSDFGDFTANAIYGSGSPSNNSYCVAKVSSDNDLSTIITGLTRNENYYFVAYAVKEISGASNDKWSLASAEVSETADLQGVSSFSASSGDAQANLSWANYSGAQGIWWDEILVLAKESSSVDATPSGDGSSYTANSTFTSGNEIGTGNYVVYKGTSTSVNVTGLNNGETYYFRTFVRRGIVWTDADQYQSTSATPSGGSGNVIITEVADYLNDAAKSYIEIYNAGSSSVNINGWQLNQYSPNASVTFNSTTQKNSAADLVLNSGEYALIVNSDWSGLKSDYGIADNVAIFVGSSVPALSGGQYYDLTDGSAKANVDEFGSSTTFSTTDEMSYERNAIPSSDGTQEESWSEVENTSYGYTPAGENNNPLPVEIIDFYAENENGKTIINWITASEINNDYFVLYKSLDAENFNPISTIFGEGNSISLNYYSAIDEDYNAGAVYYKLKQVDFDGTATYSNTISIYNDAKYSLKIQKAYFDDGNLNLLIKHNSYEILEINVYSIEGKLISHINHNSNANINTLKIDLSRSNSSQVYIIEVKDSRNREVIKIVK